MTFSTTSEAARSALTEAIAAFVDWRVDVMPNLEKALEADPEFPMAHAFKGLFLFGGRSQSYAGIVRSSLEAARAAKRGLNEVERHYIDALGALAGGRGDKGVLHLEHILHDVPTDLLAHRLLQQELFWGGEAAWMADVVDRATPAWQEQTPGFGAFQAVRAFSLEEAGRHEEAEKAGRQAVEIDASDCWGAHAVAHVLVMQGRVDDGREWLQKLCGNWGGKNQIAHHLWWHLCLFLLERGEHEQILHLLDTEVRNPESPLVKAVPDAYIDLQNVASMYLRLELRGVDVGSRWASLEEYALARKNTFLSPFTDAHAAAILAACGRFDDAEDMVRAMYDFGHSSDDTMANRYAQAAAPAAEAAIAHRKGDMHAVVNTLMPARRALWRMGGSHAQRDVFTQLLVDAAQRTGQRSDVEILIAEARSQGFHAPEARTLYRDALAA